MLGCEHLQFMTSQIKKSSHCLLKRAYKTAWLVPSFRYKFFYYSVVLRQVEECDWAPEKLYSLCSYPTSRNVFLFYHSQLSLFHCWECISVYIFPFLLKRRKCMDLLNSLKSDLSHSLRPTGPAPTPSTYIFESNYSIDSFSSVKYTLRKTSYRWAP